MISTAPLTVGRRRIFGSVFSPVLLDAHPPPHPTFDRDQTPKVTPSHSHQSTEPRPDQETWNQAWHAVTAFLAVPDGGFAPIYNYRETDGSEILKQWNRLSPPAKDTAEALAFLTSSDAQNFRDDAVPWGLFSWYGDEIRRHFLTNLRTGLYEV